MNIPHFFFCDVETGIVSIETKIDLGMQNIGESTPVGI